MVETMSRPLNAWPSEPAYSRYYPQELPSPGLRLPPLSTAVAPRDSGYDPLPGVRGSGANPLAGLDMYHGPVSSPHISSHPRSSAGWPRATTNSTPRQPEDRSNRLPSTYPQSFSNLSGGTSDSRRSFSSRSPTSYHEEQYAPPLRQPVEPSRQQSAVHPTIKPPLTLETRQDRSEQCLRSLATDDVRSPKTDTRERVRISDLLSSNEQGPPPKTSKPQVPPTSIQPPATPAIRFQYKIDIRQQPVAARSCGFGERDRRVIDPPPIVQLRIEDPQATPDDVRKGLQVPFAVMHCTIWNEAGDQDISFMPEEYRQQRRLMGTTVASPFNGRDEHQKEGCFFCFPDLSVRTAGVFRLKFVLVMVDPMANFIGARHPVRAQAMSDVFTVYSAKDFPGMQASTPLTKKLKEQGCLISIKKGNERSGRGRDDSDDDEADEDDGDTGGSTGAKRKRQRK